MNKNANQDTTALMKKFMTTKFFPHPSDGKEFKMSDLQQDLAMIYLIRWKDLKNRVSPVMGWEPGYGKTFGALILIGEHCYYSSLLKSSHLLYKSTILIIATPLTIERWLEDLNCFDATFRKNIIVFHSVKEKGENTKKEKEEKVEEKEDDDYEEDDDKTGSNNKGSARKVREALLHRLMKSYNLGEYTPNHPLFFITTRKMVSQHMRKPDPKNTKSKSNVYINDFKWSVMVLDEAQYEKGLVSQGSQNEKKHVTAKKIHSLDTYRRIIITPNLHVNSISDSFSYVCLTNYTPPERKNAFHEDWSVPFFWLQKMKNDAKTGKKECILLFTLAKRLLFHVSLSMSQSKGSLMEKQSSNSNGSENPSEYKSGDDFRRIQIIPMNIVCKANKVQTLIQHYIREKSLQGKPIADDNVNDEEKEPREEKIRDLERDEYRAEDSHNHNVQVAELLKMEMEELKKLQAQQNSKEELKEEEEPIKIEASDNKKKRKRELVFSETGKRLDKKYKRAKKDPNQTTRSKHYGFGSLTHYSFNSLHPCLANLNEEDIKELKLNELYPNWYNCATCPSPKLEAIEQSILESKKRNERTVIVSSWVDCLEIIRIYLESRGIVATMFTGDVSLKKRKTLLKDLNSDNAGDIDVLLLSKDLSVGFSLLRFNNYVVVDHHWNEALETQVLGRIYRRGQHSSKIYIWYLIVEFGEDGDKFEVEIDKRRLYKQYEKRAEAQMLHPDQENYQVASKNRFEVLDRQQKALIIHDTKKFFDTRQNIQRQENTITGKIGVKQTPARVFKHHQYINPKIVIRHRNK